uniref:ATP synthase subunit a n=2 Tax=Bilobella aurantiaca TaxID=106915 RepID=B5KMC4_BILAU|nr:ATP synthase F0 subunit 6 [Bilobella aurantiaca]ABS88967.1 ATP synthase F0 subunit 6 [Bilobella aurantiaca]
MMTNLFSSFDPCSSTYMFSNWFSSFIFISIVPSIFWFSKSRSNLLFTMVLNPLFNELKVIINNPQLKGSTFLFVSLFFVICLNNFLGLFPYIFTASSHLAMALTLALPLWLSFMLYGWIKNTKFMLAHLVPLSTPNVLMPFMVIIESVSNLIRPGTLTVRLSANMIAGHLLLSLLGDQTNFLSNSSMVYIMITLQIALLTLESAVAIIQAYVFTILSTLYSSEVI